jgi:hypothetical protein
MADTLPATRTVRWRFVSLTALLTAWMLLSPHMRDRGLMQLLLQLCLIQFVVVTLWANPRQGRLRLWLVGLWLLALLGTAATFVGSSDRARLFAQTAEGALMLPLMTLLAVGILRYVFRQRQLDVDGIFATIAAYLLIAFVFGEAYSLLQLWSPGSFDLPVAAELRTPQQLRADLLYFSLITLATVGYGDILPVSETARSLAVIEATVGLFYVAVIVAVFVGMFAASRKE